MKIKRRAKAVRILSKEKLRAIETKELLVEEKVLVEEVKGPVKFTASQLLKLLEKTEGENNEPSK